jgi:hypothetical protein
VVVIDVANVVTAAADRAVDGDGRPAGGARCHRSPRRGSLTVVLGPGTRLGPHLDVLGEVPSAWRTVRFDQHAHHSPEHRSLFQRRWGVTLASLVIGYVGGSSSGALQRCDAVAPASRVGAMVRSPTVGLRDNGESCCVRQASEPHCRERRTPTELSLQLVWRSRMVYACTTGRGENSSDLSQICRRDNLVDMDKRIE